MVVTSVSTLILRTLLHMYTVPCRTQQTRGVGPMLGQRRRRCVSEPNITKKERKLVSSVAMQFISRSTPSLR